MGYGAKHPFVPPCPSASTLQNADVEIWGPFIFWSKKKVLKKFICVQSTYIGTYLHVSGKRQKIMFLFFYFLTYFFSLEI